MLTCPVCGNIKDDWAQTCAHCVGKERLGRIDLRRVLRKSGTLTAQELQLIYRLGSGGYLGGNPDTAAVIAKLVEHACLSAGIAIEQVMAEKDFPRKDRKT